MPVQYIPHPIRAIIRDETATRDWGGNYQNTGLRPIMVILNVQFSYIQVAFDCRVDFLVDTVVPPVANQQRFGYDAWAGGSPNIHNASIVAIIPPGYWYRSQRVIGGANVVFRFRWLEIDL